MAVITLTGDNVFALQSEVRLRIDAFLNLYGDMGLESLDGEAVSFERLQQSLQSVPFLAERKLIILRRPGVNKLFGEQLSRILELLPESTDVIIIEPKLDKRVSYYKLLKKITDFHEFSELDENNMASWLIARAASLGGAMDLGDAQFLVGRVGTKQQLLANELEKLVLYSPNITRKTIELLTEATPQSTVFDLLEAAFAGNIKRALDLYYEQREQKVDTAQLIAMLVWQLRILALLKFAAGRPVQEIANAAKISPFVVRKAQPTANKLSTDRLKRFINDLITLEAHSKHDGVNADEGLRNYLFSFTR